MTKQFKENLIQLWMEKYSTRMRPYWADVARQWMAYSRVARQFAENPDEIVRRWKLFLQDAFFRGHPIGTFASASVFDRYAQQGEKPPLAQNITFEETESDCQGVLNRLDDLAEDFEEEMPVNEKHA
jgi:hypothetical protein